MLTDRTRYTDCADQKRDERLVEMADAVIIGGEVPDEPTRRLLAMLVAKEVSVRVVGMLTRVGGASGVTSLVDASR